MLWRKATAADWRYWVGVLFLAPVYLFLFMGVGRRFLHNGGTVVIWLFMTIAGLAMFLGAYYWSRFVPTKLSWILAAVAWLAFAWWSWSL